MAEGQTIVAQFLSRFPDNLRADDEINEYRPQKFQPHTHVLVTRDIDAEHAKFYDMEPVPPIAQNECARGRGRRCFIIGGGKTIENFDFEKLSRELREEDLVISINGGSCYFESDIMFYSGGTKLNVVDIFGPGTFVTANCGLLNQYCYAWADRPQIVVLPYIYDLRHELNRDVVGLLEGAHRTTLLNVEYSDLWAWKMARKTPVGYDLWAKAVRKARLYGMGADFGFMAICCAIMWGAREVCLIGFDGRFVEEHRNKVSMRSDEFFSAMWAGDQSEYSCEYERSLTPDQYKFLVGDRNAINNALFDYLRRYCREAGVKLGFLTPSIHAEEEEYVAL